MYNNPSRKLNSLRELNQMHNLITINFCSALLNKLTTNFENDFNLNVGLCEYPSTLAGGALSN